MPEEKEEKKEEKKEHVTIPAQQIGVGEILKRAWHLLTKNAGYLLTVWAIGFGIYIALFLILMLISLIFGGSLWGILSSAAVQNGYVNVGPGLVFGGLLPIILIFLILALAVGGWVEGAYVTSVNSVLAKKITPAWDNFKSAYKRIWSFVGLSVLGGLITYIGLMLLIVPGVIAMIFLFLAFYIMVHENVGAIKAISRSFELAKQRWLDIFLIILIVGVASFLLNFIPVVGYIVMAIMPFFMALCAGIIYHSITNK
jgi:hypothetical protein